LLGKQKLDKSSFPFQT